MKTLTRLTAFAVLAFLAGGCASTQGYFTDRGRDAADIITVAGGYGAGAKARVSFLNLGLIYDREVAGLRGGGIYFQEPSDNGVGEVQLLVMGQESFNIHRYPDKWPQEERGKIFFTPNLVVSMPMACPSSQQIHSAAYFTQIEVVAGLGPSIRLGFNPGELLDFLLGWFTIDIFSDDLEAISDRKAMDQWKHDVEWRRTHHVE